MAFRPSGSNVIDQNMQNIVLINITEELHAWPILNIQCHFQVSQMICFRYLYPPKKLIIFLSAQNMFNFGVGCSSP